MRKPKAGSQVKCPGCGEKLTLVEVKEGNALEAYHNCGKAHTMVAVVHIPITAEAKPAVEDVTPETESTEGD